LQAAFLKYERKYFLPLDRLKSLPRPRADFKKLTSDENQKTGLKKTARSVEAEKEGWKENIERMPRALAQIKR
jgi:hypothetical protein